MQDVSHKHLDSRFKDEVAGKIGLESIKPCYTCGSCTGVCPVHEVIPDFDPRVIIHKIALGMRQEVLSSDLIWFCCLCNSCYFVCPQRIKFSRVAIELRNMAVDEALADEEFLKRLKELEPYLRDLCRRTLFSKVRAGFAGAHTMPCWQKYIPPHPRSLPEKNSGFSTRRGERVDRFSPHRGGRVRVGVIGVGGRRE